MKMQIYTYEVIDGEFKGKIVKSIDSNLYIYGINLPWVGCYDDDGNEYVIFCDELKLISTEDFEVDEQQVKAYLNDLRKREEEE